MDKKPTDSEKQKSSDGKDESGVTLEFRTPEGELLDTFETTPQQVEDMQHAMLLAQARELVNDKPHEALALVLHVVRQRSGEEAILPLLDQTRKDYQLQKQRELAQSGSRSQSASASSSVSASQALDFETFAQYTQTPARSASASPFPSFAVPAKRTQPAAGSPANPQPQFKGKATPDSDSDDDDGPRRWKAPLAFAPASSESSSSAPVVTVSPSTPAVSVPVTSPRPPPSALASALAARPAPGPRSASPPTKKAVSFADKPKSSETKRAPSTGSASGVTASASAPRPSGPRANGAVSAVKPSQMSPIDEGILKAIAAMEARDEAERKHKQSTAKPVSAGKPADSAVLADETDKHKNPAEVIVPDAILDAALSDGSSVLCARCNSLVSKHRYEAHNVRWCPALAAAGEDLEIDDVDEFG